MGRKGQSKYKGQFQAGHQFGSWTVVDGEIYDSPATMYVKCVCGVVKKVDVYTLIKGKTTSCGCVHVGVDAPNWRGISEQRAAGFETTVSSNALRAAYANQSGTCPLTGNQLTFGAGSVAIINTGLPASPTNVCWVDPSVAKLTNVYGVLGTATTVNLMSSVIPPNIFQTLGFTSATGNDS